MADSVYRRVGSGSTVASIADFREISALLQDSRRLHGQNEFVTQTLEETVVEAIDNRVEHVRLNPRTAVANGRLWGARAADWSSLQEPQMTPIYEAAFERAQLEPGQLCLDVGCGSGLAARIAFERGAQLAGLDASAPLLEIARSRLPSGDFRQGDIEELPFEHGRFDLVTGFNVFQYAGNPTQALREARRVARRDGRVLVMTWGRPEGMAAAQLVTALRPLLPPTPPRAPGPFALSDETTLRAFAADSSLDTEVVFDVDSPWRYPDLPLALRALKSSGVAARAIDHSGEAAVDDAHAQALSPFRRPYGSYEIGATFRCLLARP